MSHQQICLIIPPTDCLLGGIGYAIQEDGRRVATPVFPPPPSTANLEKARGIRLRRAAAPLGVLYVASALIEAGYDVSIADFQAEHYDLCSLYKKLHHCSLVGLSAIGGSRDWVLRISRDIRQLKPDVQILIGGPDCTLTPELYVDSADAVVTGEVENSVADLVSAMLSRRMIGSHEGVVMRSPESGQVVYGPYRQIEYDIDSFPVPARRLVDTRSYSFFGHKNAGKITSIITSRGCPFACTFCARTALLCGSYRERSVQGVLDEFGMLYDSGYRVVNIVDSNFLVDPERARAIMLGIIERGYKFWLTVSASVHHADKELLQCMYKAGVRAISLGLESANEETLQLFRKGTTPERNAQVVRWAHDCGMFVKANFILGAPNESVAELERTVEFACSIPLDIAHFSIMTYMIGSPLWENACARGLIKDDELHVYATCDRGLGKLSLAELVDAYRHAMRRFYLRPSLYARIGRKLVRGGNRRLIGLATQSACSILRDSLLGAK